MTAHTPVEQFDESRRLDRLTEAAANRKWLETLDGDKSEVDVLAGDEWAHVQITLRDMPLWLSEAELRARIAGALEQLANKIWSRRPSAAERG